jgi:hypothetical protein
MFSLGMTADAAAAHRQHDSATSHLPSERSSSLVRQVLYAPSLPPLRAALEALEGSSDKRKSLPAMLKEQSTYGSSDEDYSRSNSLQSQNNSPNHSTSKRRRDRPKTSFHLAHPPPVTKQKQKLRIRPRLLLQLQQLSEAARPTPALDVLPSTIFAPRLASRFPRAFKGKDSLGTNDLIVVTSEFYESSRVFPEDDKSDTSEEEAHWDHREVVGTICQLPKVDGGARGKVEISFNQGSSWEATPLINGSYEFVSKDKNGLQTIARWVPRSKARRRTSTLAPSLGSNTDDDKKFTFSLVNPNTRRHPVIAAMNRTSIDVADRYPPSAPSTSTSPSSPTLSPSSVRSYNTSYFEALDLPEQAMVQTDDHLRTLIVVTGVWVAFRESWSKNFGYNDAIAVPAGSSTNGQASHRRHTSNGNETTKQQQSLDAFDINPRGGLLHVGDNIKRTSTNLLRRSSPAPGRSQSRSGTSPAPPRRSFSTGAAFIEKANRRSLSVARKSRQPAPSSGDEDEEHSSTISGVSTPAKPTLRPSIGANRAISTTPDMDLAARMAEKKRVQIGESKQEDASDETTLVDSSAGKTAPGDISAEKIATGGKKPALNGIGVAKDGQVLKKRWRRVSRIFSFLSRSS